MKVKTRQDTTEGLDRKQLHELYYYMLLTRSIEDRLLVLFRQGRLIGSLFRSLGQEATAIGSSYTLQDGDVLSPMIRDMGALLVRGHSARDIFTQYFTRKTSPTGGKDGNHHVGNLGKGTISCISMMGAVIPVVAGAAWARRMQGTKAVGMTYVGDGGTSTGDFHESLNFASVMKLPLVLICEYNNWAYSTPVTKQMNIRDIAVRAQSYGIPGYICDGNDVLEVYRFCKKAVAYARAGNGPVIVEVKTMRMRGHAEHDDASYVPREMLEDWKKKDPIDRYVNFLTSNDLMTQAEQQVIIDRVNKEVSDAEEFAVNSPLPDGQDAIKGVFADDSIIWYKPWWRNSQ